MRRYLKTCFLAILFQTVLFWNSEIKCDTFSVPADSSSSSFLTLSLENSLGIPWVLISAPPNINTIHSYQLFGPDEGWAVCTGNTIELFRLKDGRWSITPLPSQSRKQRISFFAVSPNDLWLAYHTKIPYKQNLIRFDGSEWNEVVTPNSAGIRDLWFTSASSGWAACEWGQIMHYDGTEWTLMPCPTTNHIDGILMLDESRGWAITDFPTSLLEYTQNSWKLCSTKELEFNQSIILLNRLAGMFRSKKPNDYWKAVLKEMNSHNVLSDTIQFKQSFSTDRMLLAHNHEPVIGREGVLVQTHKEQSSKDIIYIVALNTFQQRTDWNEQEFWLFSKSGLERKVVFKIPIRSVSQQLSGHSFFSGFNNVTSENGICFADFSQDGIEDKYTVITDRANRLEVYSIKEDNIILAGTEMAEKAGIAGPIKLDDGRANYDEGASSADIDNDGDQDLFVTSLYGPNLLYKQVGKCIFHEKSKELNVNRNCGRSISGIWGDVNNDGYIDLFISNQDSTNRLFLNNGAGYFKDVTRSAGVLMERGGGGSSFGDVDGDGDLDFFVPRRGMRNLLYRNDSSAEHNKHVHFTEVGDERGVSGRDTIAHSTCGVFADVDNDGDLDLFVTNLTCSNWLYLNDGHGAFKDITETSGLQDKALSQSALFLDADHDGDLDLFVGNRGASVYYRNEGGLSFTDWTSEVNIDVQGYVSGLATADVDEDGDLDIHISRVDLYGQVLNNNINNRAYLKILVKGTRSNRDAIGARLFLYESGYLGNSDHLLAMREKSGGSGFNSMSSRIAHFGVPDGKPKDLLIRFPSGLSRKIYNLNPGKKYTIYEQDGSARKFAYFKKSWIRNIRSHANQREAIFLLIFFLLLGAANIVYSKREVWLRKITLFSFWIPGALFVLLFVLLQGTKLMLSHILPVVFGLCSSLVGYIYGNKSYRRDFIRFEMIEKLFHATSIFFHGEWGSRKLNRVQLYCANLEPGTTPSIELQKNLSEAILDFYSLVVPEVERILTYAHSAGLSNELHHDTKSNILALSETLNQIGTGIKIPQGVEKKTLLSVVERIQTLQNNLSSIRNSVADLFTCNVLGILKETVVSRQDQDVPIKLKSMETGTLLGRIRPAEFSQIVDNLVDNSIRAVEKTDEKSIDITLKSNADIIFVEIADKGVGIKPEIQEKLFKEQITTKNGQGGFGLYIAKQVLEKYGGSICILQSGPDKKTVFQIQLKRVDNA